MSSATHVDDRPLEAVEQCIDYMLSGAKPPERWVIGTEHEKVGYWPARRAYPTYEGPDGIGALLEGLAVSGGWGVTREGDAIVALARDGATITLEPGGQLELSGAPLRRLADTAIELDAHLAEVRVASEPLGIEWSGLGLAPQGTPAEMPHMPKARYGIMRRYLPTRGGHALHMMHQTCTVQANFDFADEADAMRKLRLSLWLSPFVLGAFADSTIVNGAVAPERSFRGRIWLDTDNDRFVFPDRLLEPDATLRDYVEWALDVPMFFLYREGRYLDYTGASFRDFMREGRDGHHATVGDFGLHLSTLFPDARLKTHLEVRAADMGSRAHVLALPAMHVGLLYDAEALDSALTLFDGLTPAQWWAARRAVPIEGLHTRLGDASLAELGQDILRLAHAGLERWEPGAESMLAVLENAVRHGRSPADVVRERFDGDVAALLHATRIC
jgi:glutamate--cysteine ligase